MKKALSVCLLLVLSLSLSACRIGMPDPTAPAVENQPKDPALAEVDRQLDQLGTITPESWDALCAAQAAFDALPEEKQWETNAGMKLMDAWDDYYAQVLSGQWCNDSVHANIYPGDIAWLKQTVLELREDGTYTYYRDGETTGSWRVNQGYLELEGLYAGSFEIQQRQGRLYLSGFDYLCQAEWFRPWLDEVFLVVEITPENITDYIYVTGCLQDVKNEWGDYLWTDTHLILETTPQEQGWIYLESADFMAEVIIPAHKHTTRYSNGTTGSYSCVEESYTVTDTQFKDPGIGPCALCRGGHDFTEETDLKCKTFTFGRAKGTLLFIHSDYAAVSYRDGYRYVTLKLYEDNPFDHGNHFPWLERTPLE